MDKSKVQPFRRIFKYVWPQWPRLVVIFCTAMLGAVLFSLSFATVMPLLKVMMGEEGLHSWIDRRSCNWRYGMDFYVPDLSGKPHLFNQPDTLVKGVIAAASNSYSTIKEMVDSVNSNK